MRTCLKAFRPPDLQDPSAICHENTKTHEHWGTQTAHCVSFKREEDLQGLDGSGFCRLWTLDRNSLETDGTRVRRFVVCYAQDGSASDLGPWGACWATVSSHPGGDIECAKKKRS